MANFDISDPLFARLQAYATPLVDSVETTLAKVLDLADSVSKAGVKAAAVVPASLTHGAPDLTHTTLTSATINGKTLPPLLRNWNGLMLEVVKQAAAVLPKGVNIADLIVVNHIAGSKNDSGYKFLEGLGISIQGQNSNNAWKAIAHLAKTTGVKVEANFYWSNHSKAAKPGQNGYLVA